MDNQSIQGFKFLRIDPKIEPMRMNTSSFLEKLRLQDLHAYSILDTDIEESFENLVDLAASIQDCPMAAISFIDEDRQWFKAERGLNIKETSRDIAFCAHTIIHDKVLVIKDAMQDHRFDGNPLVYQDPGIRFYAGAPIVTATGFKLGAVCVIDVKPREFNEQSRKALENISRQVSRLLELRLENLSLKQKAEKLVKEQINLFHHSVQKQEEQNFQTSNELHEGIAQELAAARLYIELAAMEADTSILEESRNSLSRLIDRTRGLSMKMFPSTFPSVRIGEMLEDLSDRFMKETRIEVELSFIHLERIGREQGIILFRIIEEQLKNVERHSRARKVAISIEVGETIEVLMTDDGVGLTSDKMSAGYGITKMLSLTNYYDGNLEIFTPKNGGCALQISMPLIK